MNVKKKLTNDDVITYLSNCYNSEEAKSKNSRFLIEKLSYIPLGIVSKYKKYPNYLDLLQCGYETLWSAIIEFDINKSHNFTGLAYMWIKQKVARQALREKRYVNHCTLFGLNVAHDDGEVTCLENDVLEDEERCLANLAIRQLDKTHRTVLLDTYVNDRSLRDIGSDMSLSHESIRKLRDEAVHTVKRIIDQRLVINT